MTDLSPELIDFAAHLGTEPEAVHGIFRYCLAMLMVEQGQAELVRVELRNREPWCTFKAASGGEFTLPGPSLSPAEEQQMIKTLAEIFHQMGVALAETSGLSIASTTRGMVIESAVRYLNKEIILLPETQSQETAPARTPPARRPPAAKRRRQKAAVPKAAAEEPPEVTEEVDLNAEAWGVKVEDIPETIEKLRQLVVEARIAARELRGIVEEVRQVTEAAWVATREQRLISAEIRSAMRQYKRMQQQELEPSESDSMSPEDDLPPQKPWMEDRDKQITFAILDGMSLTQAAQKFSLSSARIKRIYVNQFRQLDQLQKVLELSHEDLVVIKAHKRSRLNPGQKPHAARIKKLLEKMWALDET